MDKRHIDTVYGILSKYYNTGRPHWRVVGKHPAYGWLKAKTSRLSITFYGLPELSTILHEFYHYLHHKNRGRYGREVDEKLAREFVDLWTPFFSKLLQREKR